MRASDLGQDLCVSRFWRVIIFLGGDGEKSKKVVHYKKSERVFVVILGGGNVSCEESEERVGGE